MAAKRKNAPSSWVPILPLHDAASGVPLFVNGFWIRSFNIGGRGTVIEFVGGGDVEVEESAETVARYFSGRART